MHRTERFPSSIRGLTMLCGALLATATAARAELPWHPDLPAALAAAAASGKPVLVIFDASWGGSGSAAASDVLASAEVEAVVAACFEPVRLDVARADHAQEARDLGIQHVPSACVLDADRQPLASFECPPTSAEFVAAAARAAQVAAADNRPGPGTAQPGHGAGDAFRAEPKPDAAIAAVSDKVRQLSSFAESSPSAEDVVASRYASTEPPAAPSSEPAPTTTAYRDGPAASVTPSLAVTPPAWPAEQAAASSLTSFQPQPPAAVTREIEPQPTTAAPWLAASQPPPAEAAPDAAAIVSDASQEPPKEKAPSGFVAMLQKPWSIFAKKPAQPATEPPTMPPALPQRPDALTASSPAATADVSGPMPLGLEGYCPVTVVERGSWVEGRPQWGARHRGRTYLFAGPEQQRAFLADPDRYAPALSGDDPVLAFENGRCEPGRRAFGVSYQSRMYLFSSPETRAAFAAEPDRYSVRVMMAEGGSPAAGARRF